MGWEQQGTLWPWPAASHATTEPSRNQSSQQPEYAHSCHEPPSEDLSDDPALTDIHSRRCEGDEGQRGSNIASARFPPTHCRPCCDVQSRLLLLSISLQPSHPEAHLRTAPTSCSKQSTQSWWNQDGSLLDQPMPTHANQEPRGAQDATCEPDRLVVGRVTVRLLPCRTPLHAKSVTTPDTTGDHPRMLWIPRHAQGFQQDP